jgi:hypothetical protein
MKAFPLVVLVSAAVLVLLSAGCESVSTSHQAETAAPRLNPSDPAKVEVLRVEPTRPHVKLGKVQARPSEPNADFAKIEAALRKEAAKLGADAVVVISDETRSPANYIGTWRTSESEPNPVRTVVAMAIKYR